MERSKGVANLVGKYAVRRVKNMGLSKTVSEMWGRAERTDVGDTKGVSFQTFAREEMLEIDIDVEALGSKTEVEWILRISHELREKVVSASVSVG